MIRRTILFAAFCGFFVSLAALPVLAQAPTDGCANPTPIAGLGAFSFTNVPATPSIPGPIVCFPGGSGQPSQLGNDVWYVWKNTNCAGINAVVSVPGATIAFYPGISTCPPSTINALCCAANSMTCETVCCQTVLIQIGNLPANASGTLTLGCSSAPVNCPCACVPPPGGMVAWYAGDDCGANDTTGNHNGNFVGFPVCPIDVKVGGGAMAFFSSPATYIKVPDHPALDFGPGNDFSIDLWVIRDNVAGIQSLVDKRVANPGIPGSAIGYSLFLFNGDLFLQLGDGTGALGHTNYGGAPLTVPADGAWHFVAVTVDRDDPNGIVMSVGNKSTSQLTTLTFNPTNRAGDLSNSAELWLGARHPISSVIVFDGRMDEIEIFSRALTQFEVSSIFFANSAGKCKCPCPNRTNPADILPCPCGNGIVNLDDILGVLSAFAGTNPCP